MRADMKGDAVSDIREDVRSRYASAATVVEGDCCALGSECGCSCGCASGARDIWGAGRYDEASRAEAPDRALLASLGCGNPTAVAELHEGETVLDLGSGGGLDVLLSAKRVGPTGRAYGLDMTDEMLALAEENRERAGLSNVEFLKGYIEDIPLPPNTVDVVISNCVVNLSPDKPRVFAETFRVLRAGGRLAITDVVADAPVEDRSYDPVLWAACIAGALTRSEYEAGLRGAGFDQIEIEDSHRVADGFASTIIRARKPANG
jgi:arsenite methyltransferase